MTSSNDITLTLRANRVFDGMEVRTGTAVAVRGRNISSVVPAERLEPERSVFDAPGCTILPGLIDVHVHFMRWQGPLYLAYGVTTVRDVGNNLAWILARRAEWQEHPWPRILCLGPLLDGPQPIWPFGHRCASLDEAVAAVTTMAGAGTDGIKLYVSLDPAWIAPMVARAHALSLPVSAHCGGLGALFAARAGVDEVFHLDGLLPDLGPGQPEGWLEVWGNPDFPSTFDAQKRLADRFRELGTIVTPTLAYWDSRRRTSTPGYPAPSDVAHQPSEFVDVQRRWPESQPDVEAVKTWTRALAAAQRFVGLLVERDVPILPGTDVPLGFMAPGQSLWRELSLLVASGMTPLRALQSATSEAARRMGAKGVGTLLPGSAADLVVVKGDPFASLPDHPEVVAVVANGRLYRQSELLTEADSYSDAVLSEPIGAAFRDRSL
jgi:hypothetical protein